ncbi:MAG: exodeoxyribonuclease III [Oscillospiraceae bacterium]|nr:exodeoxyribonuclease III [Oscillospiraceae bacterium]
MRYISWNVNGLRSCLGKGFLEAFQSLNADVFALQEIKMERGQAEIDLTGYKEFWYSANKKGYSGTAIFTKREPLSAAYGIGIPEHDSEGRVITLEFPDYYFVNCYTPNSRRELLRLPYRMEWEDAMRSYLLELDAKKPVILCGDLNVAHTEMDIKNAKSNRRNAGFTDEERAKMSELLDSGFIDTFRRLNPDKSDAYTWWSYMASARERNIGWRIDYFIISSKLEENLKQAFIYPEIRGSDHCPVGLELDIS